MNAPSSLASFGFLRRASMPSIAAAFLSVSFGASAIAHAETECPVEQIGQPCAMAVPLEDIDQDAGTGAAIPLTPAASGGENGAISCDGGNFDGAIQVDGGAIDCDSGFVEISPPVQTNTTYGTCVLATRTSRTATGGTASTTTYGVCVSLPADYCAPEDDHQYCNEESNTCRAVTAESGENTPADTTYSYGLCNGPLNDAYGNVDNGGDDDPGEYACSMTRPSTRSESFDAMALAAGVALVLLRRRARPGRRGPAS